MIEIIIKNVLWRNCTNLLYITGLHDNDVWYSTFDVVKRNENRYRTK